MARAKRKTSKSSKLAVNVGYEAELWLMADDLRNSMDAAGYKIVAPRSWMALQRRWFQKLAAQTKANLVVDREAPDDPDLIFKREGGGFGRLDRIFGGELQEVLDAFNDSLWTPAV